MTSWRSGQRITAAKLEPDYARYERTTGTQLVVNSVDTQVQFPAAASTSIYITASGTNSNAFTLASGSGVWHVTAGARLDVAHATWEMTIAVGSTTWSVANIKTGDGSSSLNVHAGGVNVDATASAKAVCCGIWQSSGANHNIGAFGGVTHIEFVRIG